MRSSSNLRSARFLLVTCATAFSSAAAPPLTGAILSASTVAAAAGGGVQPVAARDDRHRRVSMLRNAAIVPLSPTLWHVDVGRSGRICVLDKPMMWRSDASGTDRLTISRGSGPAVSIEWLAGQSVLAWPSALPIVSGSDYRFDFEGDATPRTISLVRLSAAPADLRGVVAALRQHGCQAQLDLLVRTMPDAKAMVPN